MKCICGHWHTATCHCGCPYPDDGIDRGYFGQDEFHDDEGRLIG